MPCVQMEQIISIATVAGCCFFFLNTGIPSTSDRPTDNCVALTWFLEGVKKFKAGRDQALRKG